MKTCEDCIWWESCAWKNEYYDLFIVCNDYEEDPSEDIEVIKHEKYDTSKVKTITLNGKKYIDMSVIEDIKAEIENRKREIEEVDEKHKTISMKGYVLGLVRALEIIDGKVNRVGHE